MTPDVECIRDFENLSHHRETWESLLERDTYRSLYLSYGIFSLFWHTSQEKHFLRVLLVRVQGKPIGIAPMVLKVSRRRGIPFRILTLLVPRSDILAPPDRSAVVAAIVRYWEFTSSEWDFISLEHLPEHSKSRQYIKYAVDSSEKLRFVFGGMDPSEGHLPVSGTWDDYLASRSRNFRRGEKRQKAQIERLGRVVLRSYTERQDLDRAMAELMAIEKKSWKSDRGQFLPDREHAIFLGLMADVSGAFRYKVSLLDLGDKPIAGMFSIIHWGRLYTFLTYYDQAYSAAHPGRSIISHLIEESFHDPGIDQISFVTDTPFVRNWTSLVWSYARCRVYNSHPLSRVFNTLDRIRRRKEPERTATAETEAGRTS